MSNTVRVLFLPWLLLAVLLLGACEREPATPAPAAAPATVPAPAEPSSPDSAPPGTPAAPPAATEPMPAAQPAPTPAPAAEFDPASVPESTAQLPPFPFFQTLDGLTSTFKEAERNISFDRAHVIAGDKIIAVEGKIFRDRFLLANASRPYTALEFHRNFENAITELGGRKISTVQYTDSVHQAFGGREVVDQHYFGTCASRGCENHTYLIRQGGKEYWIQVSTGAIPLHGYVMVLEREGMKQSLAFLDASAMKQAIDATGRVALYINFDVDRATLRPDAQPTIDEIGKLLAADPSLRLAIEGHTDDTGTPAHNQELSTARARTVLGALVGLGIDPARLESRGFGQDRPIADNSSEEGRAKNRRVELVRL